MRPFSATAVVRGPADSVARVVRDRLGDLVAYLDDISAVEVLERATLADGGVRLVNQWRASDRAAPAIVQRVGELAWTDEALWQADGLGCEFTIRSPAAPSLSCGGRVSYAPAMGGRGARVTVEGAFGLVLGDAAFERLMAGAVETVAGTLIPRNLRRTVEAAALLLEREGVSVASGTQDPP